MKEIYKYLIIAIVAIPGLSFVGGLMTSEDTYAATEKKAQAQFFMGDYLFNMITPIIQLAIIKKYLIFVMMRVWEELVLKVKIL